MENFSLFFLHRCKKVSLDEVSGPQLPALKQDVFLLTPPPPPPPDGMPVHHRSPAPHPPTIVRVTCLAQESR